LQLFEIAKYLLEGFLLIRPLLQQGVELVEVPALFHVRAEDQKVCERPTIRHKTSQLYRRRGNRETCDSPLATSRGGSEESPVPNEPASSELRLNLFEPGIAVKVSQALA